jgi:hypothetical protein
MREHTSIKTATRGMETENERQSRLQHQISSLRSGNRTAILATLGEIRVDGDVSILPELFDLLLDQEDEQVLLEIRTLLNDLKDQEAAPVLADAINQADYQGISQYLVAACWQNGLSYGKFLDQFVEAAIRGSYETAIEAFTVIEGAMGEVEEPQRERAIRFIRSHLPEMDDQKKILLHELVKVILSYGGSVHF